MKNLWIALLLFLTVSSCLPDKKGKNDPDPEPDLSGTYQVSRLIDETSSPAINLTLPTTTNGHRLSATVVVSRLSETHIRFNINTNIDGQITNGQTADATIQKASTGSYDLLDGSTRVGSINGTDFSIDATEAGKRIAVVARK